MAQIARPASDITTSWDPTGGPTTHYECLNDSSDSTYVQTTTNAEIFEVKLAALTDPVSSVNHVVTYRCNAAGSGGAERMAVKLMQGATTIAGPTNQTITRGSFNDYTLTLTGAQADAITDYTDLRIQAQNTMAGGETMQMSETWLSVPDAPSGTVVKDIIQMGILPFAR